MAGIALELSGREVVEDGREFAGWVLVGAWGLHFSGPERGEYIKFAGEIAHYNSTLHHTMLRTTTHHTTVARTPHCSKITISCSKTQPQHVPKHLVVQNPHLSHSSKMTAHTTLQRTKLIFQHLNFLT